jgi:hypothetical protein
MHSCRPGLVDILLKTANIILRSSSKHRNHAGGQISSDVGVVLKDLLDLVKL